MFQRSNFLNGVKVSEIKIMRLSTLVGTVLTASTLLSVSTPSRGQQPLGQQPLGQQPLGQQPLGQQPLGQQPLGQQPLGQQPLTPTTEPGNREDSSVPESKTQGITLASALPTQATDPLVLSQQSHQSEEFSPVFVSSLAPREIGGEIGAIASLESSKESSQETGFLAASLHPHPNLGEKPGFSPSLANQWFAQESSNPENEASDNLPIEEETPEPEPMAAPSRQLDPIQPNRTSPMSPGGEPDVLVAEVAVSGVEGDLEDEIYRVISLRPGRTTTRSQLQEDINAIFATGYFSKVRAEPEDTPLGVRVTFVVEANPVLSSVEVVGNTVLPEDEIAAAFADQYGEIINFRQLQRGIQNLNDWYQQQGYILAQVIDAPEVSPDGVVTLEVAEGIIEGIEIQFLNKDGETVDENGEPIEGRTKEYIITRELSLEPGGVFNRSFVERDLQRVFGLGIFEDVQLSLNPGTDPRKVVVVVNAIEKSTGSIAAGAGVSSASGLFGTVSYQEQNMFGRNQKFGAELQVGQRTLLYDVSFTDPWVANTDRLSYTLNAFRRRSISLIFDGGDNEVELENGDRPRVLRLGGGVTFSRPLSNKWRGSLGLQYQRVSIRDADGDITPEMNSATSSVLTKKEKMTCSP
jgi:outer membrane protein insertion porin family